MATKRQKLVARADAVLSRAERRKRLSVQGTARAGHIDRLKRISLILQLMTQRVPRTEIILLVMQQFAVGKSMAYRYYNQAVLHASRDFGAKHIRRLFVEQVYNIKHSIQQALSDGEYHAASSMQQHLSDLLGFRKKDGDGPSVHVQVNNTQTNNNQQATLNVPADGSMAQQLADLTHGELQRRLASILGVGAGERTALASPADGDRSGEEAPVVGNQSSSQHAREPDGLLPVPVSATVIR